MLTAIVIVIVVAVAALLIYAATRPHSFRIQRSATMRATPERIFALINNLKAWGPWSPWEKLDPAQGDSTRVDWAMYGPSPFMSKLMGVFINMDKMIGKDFEAGLTNLKSIVEKPAA